MTLRRELSDRDVQRIVEESIDLIKSTQDETQLPISPNIHSTFHRLKRGKFKAEYINEKENRAYAMKFGTFHPPRTIILDKRLPSCDHPLDMPDFAETMMAYCGVHEVIHADDHTGGDKLLLASKKHILESHENKLEKSMKIIMDEGDTSCIKGYDDLASLWAIQFVDMITHYRSYVVLRHSEYPKLEHIWASLRNDLFPPNLLTNIEIVKGLNYVFSLFTDKMGEYCMIEALDECSRLKEKRCASYMV